ncbi:conserved hypothetical protein [Pseudarthrobacter chlorophenolicus A6]|uniref:Uncharacterized protein n=1 Tax=Pseudarthrobacter chlorophenolicus (strain ATCC 700700 / DSM 12829 / CIP 107037 / JCM 12360 / KCTC 9906 / NCIMB 13794 / A6) TaxID=452863 RepID=B8HCK5_PSECP|nr:hypothetical protein [Pseudarthrobacter chlorophenolicus]ACL38788.1 conserved hypothetical protein [Pseudarthrobacter chlorophenolicus A6]SDR08750.1 hypothetical protein SAMN04489738_4748 [Pseudarthrobacter chlorophenolicus]
MSDVNDDSGKPARRPTLKWYWSLAGGLVLLFGVFVMLMPFWESVGIESVHCEVISARADTNSGGSRGSASTAGVLVDTADCGRISVSKGVTFDNRDAIAASFTAGNVYEFEIGWYSRVVLKGIQNGIPTAQSYELVE